MSLKTVMKLAKRFNRLAFMERGCWIKPYRNLTHCLLGAYALATADQQYSAAAAKSPFLSKAFQNEREWHVNHLGIKWDGLWSLRKERDIFHTWHYLPDFPPAHLCIFWSLYLNTFPSFPPLAHMCKAFRIRPANE